MVSFSFFDKSFCSEFILLKIKFSFIFENKIPLMFDSFDIEILLLRLNIGRLLNEISMVSFTNVLSIIYKKNLN